MLPKQGDGFIYFDNTQPRYSSQDGRSIKGAVRASFHIALSCLTFAGTIGGYALLMSGMTAFACSAAELSVEIADCFNDKVPNAEVFPSGFGGCVGSRLDIANGFDAQKGGYKESNQVKGASAETLVYYRNLYICIWKISV